MTTSSSPFDNEIGPVMVVTLEGQRRAADILCDVARRGKVKERSVVGPRMPETPNQLIDRLLQQRVTLLLKDARILSGKLLGCDEHLNIVLDAAEETTQDLTRRLGRVVLRGSNVISLNAPGGSAAKGT
ncbi:MAG: LSM domain-containing protein [Thermoplasmata archaeon]